ncbi:DUF924 family protein [Noviherbaspirillum denitrificans]|uniref:DUF924 domain-containing protein n=1 Tax=Noviherbaspirillum denitrificans TaxID=1968433 RepID=A0A254TDU6_9BURK|nr:DUF924 family protein [Noviherbaspirillum denitrificans]OWW19482.1 hypothetical protein AYR66_08120 [Noviherbaspirillum denitrificans]
MSESPESILEFWFGHAEEDDAVAAGQAKLWWTKRDETDLMIRRRFEDVLRKAARGELDAWAGQPRGRLALIILTDQFSRNMYRNTPEAFACDERARGWCRERLRSAAHRPLRPIERVFFYLPLEHSESLDDQEQSVSLFRELSDAGKAFAGFFDYAVRHREVIARFGRFPHRNRILGRESTAEEVEFLKQPGSSF